MPNPFYNLMARRGPNTTFSPLVGQTQSLKQLFERFSRDDAAEHMIHSLEDMLRTAPSERHREAINDCIRKLRNY